MRGAGGGRLLGGGESVHCVGGRFCCALSLQVAVQDRVFEADEQRRHEHDAKATRILFRCDGWVVDEERALLCPVRVRGEF